MDKTYFSEDTNLFDENKMVYRFYKRYKGNDLENYTQTIVKQLYDLLAHYGVDYNEHIDKITPELQGNEGESQAILLNVYLNNGKESKKHIRSRIGVLKLVQPTPQNIPLYGRNSEYNFVVKNITDEIYDNLPGVYLFTVQVEDHRPNIEFSHSILSFNSVQRSNRDTIEFAKRNGAYHFLCYDCVHEDRRQEIIEDIKEGENYKFQIANFPELFITPQFD